MHQNTQQKIACGSKSFFFHVTRTHTYTHTHTHTHTYTHTHTHTHIHKHTGSWRIVYDWSDCNDPDQDANLCPGMKVRLLNPDTRNTEYGINHVNWSNPQQPLTPYPTRYMERSLYLIEAKDVYIGGPSGIFHKDCKIYAGGLCAFDVCDVWYVRCDVM